MTREEYNEMCLELIKRGYKRNFGELEKPRDNGMNYYCKVIERRKDEYGEERAINQLFFKIWHFENYKDRIPYNSLYSLEPVIMFSRSTDERIDLNLQFPERSIDELEQIAKDFGEWCKQNIRKVVDNG